MTVNEKYKKIVSLLIEQSRSVTTMESCTGGAVASLITDNEGASAILKGAFVTYSNEAKIRAGVPADTIDTYGVYSVETAVQMAKACKAAFAADIGIGVTGSFANVDPNNRDSVPGQVHFAVSADRTESVTLTVTESDRHLAKQFVADAIADKLLSLLD